MFWKSRRKKAHDLLQQVKIEESQRCLLTAATETANAAHAVTTLLKSRLDDALKQFQYTARILNDALFVCDLDGTIRASNPAARHMFGEASLIDTSILGLFDLGDTRLTSADVLWSMIRHSSRWSVNDPQPLRGRQPITGKLFWVEPACAALDWSDGTASMLVIVRNVDPIVSLRDSGREAKNKFQSLFDLSFDGLLIEQNDRIVAANDVVGSIFGYATPELLARPISVLFVPEDHGRVEANLEKCTFTVHGLHASGTLRTILFSATQVTWKSATARLITVRDVTEMRAFGDPPPTRSSDNGIEMICCFDPTFKITFVNPSFACAYGLDRKAVIGTDVRDYLGRQDVTSFTSDLCTLSINHPSTRTQVRDDSEAGKLVVHDWIDHAVFDETGQAIEYQRIGRDISSAMQGLLGPQ
jgi:PAS domain S-box-containing protein